MKDRIAAFAVAGTAVVQIATLNKKFKVSKLQPSYEILGYSTRMTPEPYHGSWIWVVKFTMR